MWNGKMKAVTFSYDDGVLQDKRLIKLFNKYGLKGTFNINSGFIGQAGSLFRNNTTVAHCKYTRDEIPAVYAGHEIAAHTLTHPFLKDIEDDAEIIRQVEEDRLALSEIAGYEVRGMAYPMGSAYVDERVFELVRNHTGIRYARTTTSTHSFDLQDDLIAFHPTEYHLENWDTLTNKAIELIEMTPDRPQLFYVWGHAYEFDAWDDWDKMEEFCRLISGHSDIFYGTNSDILL